MQVNIQYNETVTSVTEGKGNKKWTIETVKQDGSKAVYHVEAVIVCVGENTIPLIPSFPDQKLFKGPVVHSSRYQTAEEYRGKKVLVVGFGNTGGELSIDLYEHGCNVHILARSPVNIIKRRSLFIAPFAAYLPTWFQLAFEWVITRLDFGDMHKYGIRCPISSGFKDLAYYRLRRYHEAPVVDIGQIELIRESIIKVKNSEIAKFTSTGVIFKDGKEETYDAVILATGFKHSLDQIFPKSIYDTIINEQGFPHDAQILHEKTPGLYFIGFSDRAGRILKMKEDAIETAAHINSQLYY